jgi:hypothetical protein
MNEHTDTIKELKKLQQLPIPNVWVDTLHAKVLTRITHASPSEYTPIPSPLYRPSLWSTYRTLVVSTFILFLSVTFFSHDALYAESLAFSARTQLILSEDAAERATVALLHLSRTVHHFSTSDTTPLHSYPHLHMALNMAHAELEGLQLQGESGMYTQGECFTLYQEYDTLIDSLHNTLQQKLGETTLSMEERAALTDLLRRSDEALVRIEERISLYPK